MKSYDSCQLLKTNLTLHAEKYSYYTLKIKLQNVSRSESWNNYSVALSHISWWHLSLKEQVRCLLEKKLRHWATDFILGLLQYSVTSQHHKAKYFCAQLKTGFPFLTKIWPPGDSLPFSPFNHRLLTAGYRSEPEAASGRFPTGSCDLIWRQMTRWPHTTPNISITPSAEGHTQTRATRNYHRWMQFSTGSTIGSIIHD